MNRPVNRRALKAASLRAMQGSWLRSIIITILSALIPMILFSFLPLRVPGEEELAAAGGDLFSMLALFLPRNVTSRTVGSFAVTAVLYLLIVCPFNVGIHRFYLAVASGERGKLSDVFSAFTSLRTVFSSIWLGFITDIASLFWAVVLLLPPCLLAAAGAALGSQAAVVLSSLLILIMSVIYLLRISIYKFAVFIFAEGKTGGAWRSFRAMQKYTRGRMGELMTLRATYFGWDIASGLLIPALTFIYNGLFGTVYAKYLFCLRHEEATCEPGFENEESILM